MKKVPYGKIGNGQTNFRKKKTIQIFCESERFKRKFKDSNQHLLSQPLLVLFSKRLRSSCFRSMLHVTSVATNDKNDFSPYKRLPRL